MIAPAVERPPAADPQSARAKMRASMHQADAQPAVVAIKSVKQAIKTVFLPRASVKRPRNGCVAVRANKKEVDSHEAERAELKYDVITGWADVITVESNPLMNWDRRICEKTAQNLLGELRWRKLIPSSVFALLAESKGVDS